MSSQTSTSTSSFSFSFISAPGSNQPNNDFIIEVSNLPEMPEPCALPVHNQKYMRSTSPPPPYEPALEPKQPTRGTLTEIQAQTQIPVQSVPHALQQRSHNARHSNSNSDTESLTLNAKPKRSWRWARGQRILQKIRGTSSHVFKGVASGAKRVRRPL
ncbi:hypothetical protein BDW74DRAFT_184321 [Aspergillus multicolor]|uniref:uncharacterized protein n=1 Tax=Aspergillus multicolor TaxID=41759 RepID=UPI003CCE254B